MDYHFGLSASLYIVGIIPFIIVIPLGIAAYKDDKMGFLPATLLFGVVAVSIASLIFLSLWPGIFAVVNVTQAFQIGPAFIRNEMVSGVLGLRVVSLILTFKSVTFLWKWFDRMGANEETAVDFSPDLEEVRDWAHAIKPLHLSAMLMVQFIFYNLVVAGLWHLIIHEQASGVYVQALNWSLFFIVDDWILISDFMAVTKGRCLPMHRYRLIAINLVIVVLSIKIAFDVSNLWLALGFTAVAGLLLTLRFVLERKERKTTQTPTGKV